MRKASKDNVTVWKRRHEDYRSGGLSRKAVQAEAFSVGLLVCTASPPKRARGTGRAQGMAAGPAAAACPTLVMVEGLRGRLAFPWNICRGSTVTCKPTPTRAMGRWELCSTSFRTDAERTVRRKLDEAGHASGRSGSAQAALSRIAKLHRLERELRAQ